MNMDFNDNQNTMASSDFLSDFFPHPVFMCDLCCESYCCMFVWFMVSEKKYNSGHTHTWFLGKTVF